MKISKPILRHQRTRKPFVKRNDAVPGYLYVFYDREASLCKIGLSRKPKTRRYYLSNEYQSQLEIVGIAPIVNMRWGEQILHNQYSSERQPRHPRFDGYTEWFAMSSLMERLELRIALWLTAIFVTGSYVLSALLVVAVVLLLIF